ncbi:MAG: DsbA family protein [Candidatus Doudnabacteria bacterium]|nr:DsbA family protein [Candidatus Doudnabacteria bacterium]
MKTFIIAAAIVVVALTAMSLANRDKPGSLSGSHTGNPSPKNPNNLTLLTDDDPVLGDTNAPVTLVEFGDYQCTFCTKFFKETEKPLIEKYVNTGKVKLVFRDFAINGRESVNAAIASECADEQEKFWEYHDKLYTERRGYNVGVFKQDSLISFAKELGLNEQQFSDCYKSGKYDDEVANDTRDAQAFGGRGTPTFFLNGQIISGALPLSVFENYIESALSEL